MIAIEGWIHLAVADGTKNPLRTTNVDTPLPLAATSEARTDTDIDSARAPTNENTPRDTETTTTAMDHLIDTDRPTEGTTTTKIPRSVGDVDAIARSGTVIGITIGRSTRNCRRDHQVFTTRVRHMRVVITEVILEVTTTTLQVYTRANTNPGTTLTPCRFPIILTADSMSLANSANGDNLVTSRLPRVTYISPAMPSHPLPWPNFFY